MNKDILISKQQLEIEIQNKKDKQNKKLIKQIKSKFISVGAPLNDNILKMNKEQLGWCDDVLRLIEQLK